VQKGLVRTIDSTAAVDCFVTQEVQSVG